ncbi:MAG: hypothetical protein RIQ41_268 [Candidatus Parcubacteria bacterium]
MSQPREYILFKTDTGGTIAQQLGIPGLEFSTAKQPVFSTPIVALFTLSVGIIVVVAVLRIAWAQSLLIFPSLGLPETAMPKIKKMLSAAIYGLILVLGIVLIPRMFNTNFGVADIKLEALWVGAKVAQIGTLPVTGATPTQTTTPSRQVGDDETTNRQVLSDAGIGVNKSPCGAAASNCTNVGGIHPKTIELLLKVRSECKCSLIVTGGTEPGHSEKTNHGVGKEAVDISYTPTLENFLKQNGSTVINSPPCNVKYLYGGFIFWLEWDTCPNSSGDHFHASFTGR